MCVCVCVYHRHDDGVSRTAAFREFYVHQRSPAIRCDTELRATEAGVWLKGITNGFCASQPTRSETEHLRRVEGAIRIPR